MPTRILTVTEFLKGINEVLASVPALVEGEVSGFAIRQERWVFFSLKDDENIVECFMPAWKLHAPIEDGMLVRVAGLSGVYAKTGRFRITVEALELAGEGSLKRAFELLKAKLEHEGLFATERKRAIPRFPETIGLIASTQSAAYTDFVRIIKNRWGGVRVIVHDVRVQGDGAVEDIVKAFTRWPRAQLPDIFVLTRGGGSLEDLQAFNAEEIARAIFASPIPVIVGVGHERDITIADFVADVRASTPSNAAERVVPDRRDVANEIEAMVDAMESQLGMTVRERRSALDRFMLRGAAFASRQIARVDSYTASLVTHINGMRTRIATHIESAERLLANLNPTKLLARGYSMTTINGRVIRDVSQLKKHDRLVTRFARGSAESIIENLSTSSTDIGEDA